MPLIITIITPFMNRVHKEVQQSGELVLSMLLLIQNSTILSVCDVHTQCIWSTATWYLDH